MGSLFNSNLFYAAILQIKRYSHFTFTLVAV